MANIASNVIKEKLVNLKTTIPIAFKIVFSNPFYIAMAGVVSTIFWIVFNSFDQLLFFSPIISFYLPDDAIPGFILTNITSILMGILVAMNVHVIRNSKIKLDKSLLSGSILGIASSACASCSSLGFLVISIFGGFGTIATDLLTNYQIPLRTISICILLWALYSVQNRITKSCIINNVSTNKQKMQQPSSSSSSSSSSGSPSSQSSQHQRRRNNSNT
jgi:hypothetical protein